jgi:hypothetical protein
MIKYVTVLFRREGMSREEFGRYWKDTHAPILTQIPGLRGYVQNHALPDSEGNEPPYDGFGELHFDTYSLLFRGSGHLIDSGTSSGDPYETSHTVSPLTSANQARPEYRASTLSCDLP